MFNVSDDVAAKTFKIAVGDAHGSAQHALGEKFVELFAEKTGGKHTAKMFLNGQLGSEQDTVNEAAIGTLDFSLLAINNITPFSPTVGVFTLPYVILSLEDAEKLTQGEIGKELTENTIRDAGVRIIGWTYTGFRVLTNSKKPIKTLEDLQGVVVRVPKNEIMIDTYKAWGINPTPMAWSETFTALQQKVVGRPGQPLPDGSLDEVLRGAEVRHRGALHLLDRAVDRQRVGVPGHGRGDPDGRAGSRQRGDPPQCPAPA